MRKISDTGNTMHPFYELASNVVKELKKFFCDLNKNK